MDTSENITSLVDVIKFHLSDLQHVTKEKNCFFLCKDIKTTHRSFVFKKQSTDQKSKNH